MNGHALTCPAGYRDGERCECIHQLRENRMSEPRFCKDCRHCVGDDLQYAKCALFPKRASADADYLVTGVRTASLYFCATMRGIGGECGADGKRWEPKT